MHLQVFGKPSKNEQIVNTLKLLGDSKYINESGRSILQIDFMFTRLLINSYEEKRGKQLESKHQRKNLMRWAQEMAHDWFFGEMQPWMHERGAKASFFAEALPNLMLSLKAGQEIHPDLYQLLDIMKLNVDLSTIVEGGYPRFDKRFKLSEWGPRLDRRRYRPNPVGMWLEPLLAEGNAVVKGLGESGIDQVLGWLSLARHSYGYAWRVLVDWRNLKNVQDHPAFIAFIEAEDKLANRIEHAIDVGTLPL